MIGLWLHKTKYLLGTNPSIPDTEASFGCDIALAEQLGRINWIVLSQQRNNQSASPTEYTGRCKWYGGGHLKTLNRTIRDIWFL
jgi:hypothetical protein